MMGTPCFLLGSACRQELIPHKMQGLDASEFGVMEGENTLVGGARRGCVAERSERQLQRREPSGEAELELERQLERQPRGSFLPGLLVTTPPLVGGVALLSKRFDPAAQHASRFLKL